MALQLRIAILTLALAILGALLPAWGQSLQSTPESGSEQQKTGDFASPQASDQRTLGSISGTVIDASGALVAGAQVQLTRGDQSAAQQVLSDLNGQFSFSNLGPGPYRLTISSAGFAPQTSSGILQSGESHNIPVITLPVATADTEVQVAAPLVDIAEDEIKVEEKQRVLGVFPNFYVSYDPDAVPLNSRQKFELAWKTMLDPVSFAVIGAVAGVQQGLNDFSGYGQGAQGYGKRYGASYADFVTGTLLGSALLPSLLKQDPRYFMKATGTRRSRFFYALANAVICKGDNGRWQTNYSSILGNFAAGGISNLYYPAQDRGAALTFENGLVGIGSTGAVNLFEEFLVRKITPHLPDHEPAKQ